MITESLFVYGTLAPGASNAYLLQEMDGEWLDAKLRGHFHASGWGLTGGYPAVVVDDSAGHVCGFIFRSTVLSKSWPELDAFEGDCYQRIRVAVELVGTGAPVSAWVYALHARLSRAVRLVGLGGIDSGD